MPECSENKSILLRIRHYSHCLFNILMQHIEHPELPNATLGLDLCLRPKTKYYHVCNKYGTAQHLQNQVKPLSSMYST